MAAPRKITENMRATYVMSSTNLTIAGSNIFSSKIMIMNVLLKVGSETGYFSWVLSEKCSVKLRSKCMTSYDPKTMVFGSSSSLSLG